VIKIVDIGGVQMGWSMNTQYNTVDEVYVETARLARARMIIKELLWKKYNCNALLMRQVKPSLGSREPDQAGNVMFEHDTLIDPLPSAAADRYITYLQRCVNAGVRRSIMLYGPPGTGKSTMARAILHGMNFTSFRVRIGDLNNLEISTFFEAIEIFEPDAIILDDFDRSHNQEELLEVLEYFRKNVKLVIATANSRQNIDEALMRPGRFDELEPVTRMDDDVIKKILGEHVDVFEQVKDWPIVFIEEYKIRRQFMTSDEAINALQELAKRVQRLSVYNDDDSDGIVKLLRATNGRPRAINVGGHVITMEELEDEIEEDGDSIPPPFQEMTPRDGPSDCHGPKDTNTCSNHVTYLEPPQSLPGTENAAECSLMHPPRSESTSSSGENDPRNHRMKNLDTPRKHGVKSNTSVMVGRTKLALGEKPKVRASKVKKGKTSGKEGD
jgi:DNA replication protein DnaC